MVDPIQFHFRPAYPHRTQLSQSVGFYRSSNAFISSTSAILRTSNTFSSFCNLQPSPMTGSKPRINSRLVISNALNHPRRKSKSKAKKPQEIKHANAEIISESEFNSLDDSGSDDDDDDDDDVSQLIQVIELDGHGEYDEEEDDDDDEGDGDIIINISNEDDDDNDYDISNEDVAYIEKGDSNIVYVDESDFDERQYVETNFTNLSIATEDDFDDDDNGTDNHVGGVRAYDDNGVTVIDVSAPAKRKEERARTRSLLDAITTQPEPDTAFAADAESQPPIELDDSAEYVRTVVRSADTRKAEDIRVLRVSKLTYITSFIIVVTGNSAPQIRAIANLVEEDLSKKHKLEPNRIDGVPSSGWILLDCMSLHLSNCPPIFRNVLMLLSLLTNAFTPFYSLFCISDGDFMVNVFSPEQRRNYNLESLWSRAEVMDISNFLIQRQDEPQPSAHESLDDWL